MNTPPSAPAAPVLGALRSELAFQPEGPIVGNLALGSGTLDRQTVRVALIENRIASGSIGKKEVAALVPFLVAAKGESTPVVLFLDSAGARISEALEALGAFRQLFRAVIATRAAGVPVAAVLGRNCYGGASMLAHAARRRLFSPDTRLAMSGPSILAQSAGVSALDEMFRAMADAAIGAESRAKTSHDNTVWSPQLDLQAWLREALAMGRDCWHEFQANHERLRARLVTGITARPAESIRRKDLERLYPAGYRASECDGVIQGEATSNGEAVPVLGLVGRSPVCAERAWRFADAAWQLASVTPADLVVLLDCESHAPRLEDERLLLTEFIVDMGLALAALAARGTRVELTVLDRAGGGVYVALAAPASRVSIVHGADIQVLPGSAVASILGTERNAVADIAEYRCAGVADIEHKLGLLP